MKISGNSLRQMFDYQKFSGEKKLAGIIADTESRYEGSRELSEDDLMMVSAALNCISKPRISKREDDSAGDAGWMNRPGQ